MHSSTLKWSAIFLILLAPVFLKGQNEGYAEPDSVLLKDGSTERGVIVKNTADMVFLQQRYRIAEIPKSTIVRIFDGVDTGMEFTDAGKKGDLPSWRVMVNDIRNNDTVRSLEEIPPTLIDNGYLKNVPYLSFRINDYIEMNVYGNPDDPAAIEFGVYGKLSSSDKLRRTLRSFMAGFLSSRKEVAAIYSIPFSGGEKNAGDFRIRITPPTAPDAYRGWWICLYNPKALESARVSDEDYAKATLPPELVVDRSGKVKPGFAGQRGLPHSLRVQTGGDGESLFALGFFRDPVAGLRLLFHGGQ
ncbi:MAG: hypothetical protein WCG66_09075 [bacterium]